MDSPACALAGVVAYGLRPALLAYGSAAGIWPAQLAL